MSGTTPLEAWAWAKLASSDRPYASTLYKRAIIGKSNHTSSFQPNFSRLGVSVRMLYMLLESALPTRLLIELIIELDVVMLPADWFDARIKSCSGLLSVTPVTIPDTWTYWKA